MPTYDYRCGGCGKKTSVFLKTMGVPESVTCTHCDSADMQRVFSTFAHHKSKATVWEQSGSPMEGAGDEYYSDPRNIGRWAEDRLDQLGVDMPSEARHMIDAARDGTMPDILND